MPEFKERKQLLDQINAVIIGYDPVLREKARDILLEEVFGLEGGGADSRESVRRSQESAAEEPITTPTLGSLMYKWLPKIQSEHVLLCLYYLQKVFGLAAVDGRRITRELINYDMRVTNITVAMLFNSRRTPPFITTVAKAGTTRQARNEYSITEAGIKYVESRLRRDFTS